MTKNTDSTRYYSKIQENHVAKVLGGYVISNSGAGKFNKSDVVIKKASLSVECKTSMSVKNSLSIKKEWIDKHKEEAYSNRYSNDAVCIRFSPEGKDYYIIDEKLMKFLVDKLENDESI